MKRGPHSKRRYPRSLTEWGDPMDVINSGWGNISYREWCRKAQVDFEKAGKVCKIDVWCGVIAVVEVHHG